MIVGPWPAAREDHCQPIDAQTETTRRQHAVRKRLNVGISLRPTHDEILADVIELSRAGVDIPI